MIVKQFQCREHGLQGTFTLENEHNTHRLPRCTLCGFPLDEVMPPQPEQQMEGPDKPPPDAATRRQ